MANKNPMDMFFNLGNKVTKGDPVKTADFNYYMLWIMFVAFFSILITNLHNFVVLISSNQIIASVKSLAWSGVMFAIIWFQYQALDSQRKARKQITDLYKDNPIEPPSLDIEEESIDDMLKQFKDKKEEKV